MIVIIDYDMGNLRSVQKGFERVGCKNVLVSQNPDDLLKADRIVLPGVGAFEHCMKNLKKHNLIDPIRSSIKEGKPFLGICLGLQVLFDEGYENGKHKGLGILPGKVVRFKIPVKYKIPHMGWNRITKKHWHPVLNGIDDQAHFYFVHSYHVVPTREDIIMTTTDYGIDFVSSVAKKNIFACQFHPEKSQDLGLKLLKNFSVWKP